MLHNGICSYILAVYFDIVLLDLMFHFYKKDFERETNFLKKIVREMKTGSILCNFLLSLKAKEDILKSIIDELGFRYEVLVDGYANYPEANCVYHMYVIRKL